jgi:uncharacterized protein (DUF58 family)
MSQQNQYNKFALKGTKATLSELINLQYIARSLPPLPNAKIKSNQHGGHISKLRGRGIEFDEVRIYQAGDDIKRMDWKITAKTGKPHTKLFHDERDRPVYLLIDDRANMQFGTRNAFKSVIAAEIASIFAWAASIHGDKVGAVITNGEDCIELKPYMRKQGVLPILKKLTAKSNHANSELSEALIHLRHVITPGSLIFIISDFYNLGNEFEKHLSRLRIHNEIVSCYIYDVFEKELPKKGIYQVSDGKKRFQLNAGDAKFKRSYHELFAKRYDEALMMHNKWNIPMLELATNDNVPEILINSLKGVKRR